MNTIRVIENKTGKILEERAVIGMGGLFNTADTLRHKYNNKIEGGCTIKGYYTTPEDTTEETKAVIDLKTWDCL